MKSPLRTLPLALSCLALLSSCGASGANTGTEAIEMESVSIETDAITNSFVYSSSGGEIEESEGIYRISSAGTYTLSGKLEGMIYVEAGEEDEVELDLDGFSITNSENSPIFIASASKVKIKAKKGTSNFVTDARSEQTIEDSSQGAGAIYAKADLDLSGKGSLTVKGNYNNGVHTSKDLDIKNLTLAVTAINNAIKGNHSIEIYSGAVSAISTKGDGLKSEDSDMNNSNTRQRGYIDICGGEVNIFSGCDGIDAATSVHIYEGEDDEGNPSSPKIGIATNKYSSYTDSSLLSKASSSSSAPSHHAPGGPGGNGGGFGPGSGDVPSQDGSNADKAEDSAKGIKADDSVTISAGKIVIQAYDDGIHANSDALLETSSYGSGDVTISGGETIIACSDDGIHADGTLKIEDGLLTVNESHEGLEGKYIVQSGGKAIAYANDDGVNASSAISISGGYLFAAVSPSGDTDGIDSNGTYSQTGGVVIAAGPNNMNAAALDTDGSVSIEGGTFICFGFVAARPSGNLTSSSKSGSYGGKAYTLSFALGSVETAKLTSSGYGNLTTYSELGSLSSIS